MDIPVPAGLVLRGCLSGSVPGEVELTSLPGTHQPSLPAAAAISRARSRESFRGSAGPPQTRQKSLSRAPEQGIRVYIKIYYYLYI